MKEPKFVFLTKDDDESPYPIERLKEYMRSNNWNDLPVYKAKRIIGSDYFYCSHFYEVGEKGNCGKDCEGYKPRNGKSGICLSNKPVYEAGEKITIKLKQ